MIYVVVEELIPESQNGEHTNIGTIGVAVGFALMMVLDVALGWMVKEIVIRRQALLDIIEKKVIIMVR